ncbi:hypothetical protein NDU88_004570 [Pleurodeles waltl]|uniref:Uncharacterized protein n=1 Tax=Pleurodeles waltl TaxID=8319 RepID=A0AAV7LV07_PLEWA|nr:hypothetical protein NDU88_004570 [Pleurodeles waltl]
MTVGPESLSMVASDRDRCSTAPEEALHVEERCSELSRSPGCGVGWEGREYREPLLRQRHHERTGGGERGGAEQSVGREMM